MAGICGLTAPTADPVQTPFGQTAMLSGRAGGSGGWDVGRPDRQGTPGAPLLCMPVRFQHSYTAHVPNALVSGPQPS